VASERNYFRTEIFNSMAQRQSSEAESISDSQRTRRVLCEPKVLLSLRRGRAQGSVLMGYDILVLKNEGSTFFRNVGIRLRRAVASYPEVTNCSSLPCLQRPATWLYPETTKSIPCPSIPFV
jgi:hypothetical protein